MSATSCHRLLTKACFVAGAAGEGSGDDLNNLFSDLEPYVPHVTPDIDEEVKDRRVCTPLHPAAAKGHPESVRCLLSDGANMKARGKDGHTLLDLVQMTKERVGKRG